MVQKSGLPVEIESFFPWFTRGFLHPRWFFRRISEPSTVVWRLGFQPKHSKFTCVFSKNYWTVTQNTPPKKNIHLTNHCFGGYVWFICFIFADEVAFTFQPLDKKTNERLDLGGGNSNMLFLLLTPDPWGFMIQFDVCAYFLFRWGWVFPKNMGTPKWMIYSGKPY